MQSNNQFASVARSLTVGESNLVTESKVVTPQQFKNSQSKALNFAIYLIEKLL
jgi:hypothetical protein